MNKMIFVKPLLNKMLNLLRDTPCFADGAQGHSISQIFGHADADLDGFFIAHSGSLTPVRL